MFKEIKEWVVGLFAKAKEETSEAIAACKREAKIEFHREMAAMHAARADALEREKG